MELAIALDPLVEQVMVIERRPYLTVCWCWMRFWPSLAQEYGLDSADPVSLENRKVMAVVLGI